MTNPYAEHEIRLHELWEVTQRRASDDKEWRATIRKAVNAGYRITDIAEAAGISRARVYQILGEQK